MSNKTIDVAFTAVVTVLPVLNKYKVPKTQWRKWNQVQRQLFNDTYSFSLCNQSVLSHPKMDVIDNTQWNTLCWNFAWIAADNLKNQKLVKVKDGC